MKWAGLTATLLFVPLLLSAGEPESPTVSPSASPSVIPTWTLETAKGYLPYRQLNVEDFPVRDKRPSEGAYYIQTFLHYYYHYLMKMARGGMIYAYVMDWTVFSGFDKNLSFRNSKFHQMQAELPYAQVILDINELYARRLAALQPGELPSASGKNWQEAQSHLKSRVDQLCEMQLSEARIEQNAFTSATDHGQNKKKVRELSAEIKKRLAILVSATPSPSAVSTVSPSAVSTVSPTAGLSSLPSAETRHSP
jgi:hypothetical protein